MITLGGQLPSVEIRPTVDSLFLRLRSADINARAGMPGRTNLLEVCIADIQHLPAVRTSDQSFVRPRPSKRSVVKKTRPEGTKIIQLFYIIS